MNAYAAQHALPGPRSRIERIKWSRGAALGTLRSLASYHGYMSYHDRRLKPKARDKCTDMKILNSIE